MLILRARLGRMLLGGWGYAVLCPVEMTETRELYYNG
jgi:hypothetical protein